MKLLSYKGFSGYIELNQWKQWFCIAERSDGHVVSFMCEQEEDWQSLFIKAVDDYLELDQQESSYLDRKDENV